MGNGQVIWLHGIKPPHTTKDIHDRYESWVDAAYIPLFLKNPGMTGVDRFKIVNESPDYPEDLNIWYFDSLSSYEGLWIDQGVIAVLKDMESTWPQYGRERIWGGNLPTVTKFPL